MAVHLCHFIHSDGAGGGPKVVRQLLEWLPRKEYVQTFVHGGSGAVASWCREVGIQEIRVPTGTLASGVLGFRSLVRAFENARPDIAIFHGQWAGPLGALAGKAAKVPRMIYIAHCPAFYHSTSLFRAIRNYIAEKIPCTCCDRVVALSDGNYYNYLYRGWAPERHLVKIHNGLDPDDLPSLDAIAKIRAEFFKEEGAKNIVFAGRIDDQKRVDWLLEAWKACLSLKRCQDVPAWRLWIVGDGKEKSAMERICLDMGLASSATFVGSRPDAMAWIAAADVTVLTSLYEGHSLVPLEAMACGKPVVAFFTDGITDSVLDGETGFLVPLGDTGAFAAKLAHILSSPDLCLQIGRNARARLEEIFPLERTISSYRRLFGELSGPP